MPFINKFKGASNQIFYPNEHWASTEALAKALAEKRL
jgi:hypothetical protein